MKGGRGGGGKRRGEGGRGYLRDELEVDHDDRDLGAGDDEDEEDNEEEAKEVVIAMQPNARHDEEELDEDGAKGEDTT